MCVFKGVATESVTAFCPQDHGQSVQSERLDAYAQYRRAQFGLFITVCFLVQTGEVDVSEMSGSPPRTAWLGRWIIGALGALWQTGQTGQRGQTGH